MSDNEMKPCPFCGGPATFEPEIHFSTIKCKNCEAAPSVTRMDFKEAQRTWNKRPTDETEDAADDYRLSSATRKEWAERALKAEAERDRLRDVAHHASVVIRYLEGSGGSVVPHLMDTDDNPGQRLRDALAALNTEGDT